MATTSGGGKGPRKPAMPFVTYAIVLAVLGAAGIALWTRERSGPPGASASDRASPAISKTAPLEPAHAAQGLKLPPRPARPEAATAPARQEPAQEAAVPSPAPQDEAGNGTLAAPAAETPEPPKSLCSVDVGPWPTDKTEQAKAVQMLLRALGLYGGTTYGTVGPATRAAISKFQLATGEAETGEPSEMLFELLKRRCASP